MFDKYDWFKIFNIAEFEARNIPSLEIVMDIQGRGEKTFHITKGESIGVTCDDVYIPTLLGNNPQAMDDMSLYRAGNTVFWGFKVDED